MVLQQPTAVRSIAVIGNYLPRRCGIATFTTHLCDALSSSYPNADVFAIAMNDRAEGYDYPDRVRFEIPQHDPVAYRRIADILNLNDVDLVCLQHEYGIFGGEAGDHILTLLRDLRMPIVTTLHTVLREPNAAQRRVLLELARLSARLVVMSERGATFLREIYGIAPEKIVHIPHGIPDIAFVDPNYYKDKFDVAGRTTLMTFGLLSGGKGIEHVIDAMPAILERDPSAVYTVLGATHPNVKAHEGERYRKMLQSRAAKLGVTESVVFHDAFVDQEELIAYVGATDIYITPYLNPAQITSGTLAYTVGAGKAVISTPYWYAEELLGEDRGKLVAFADGQAIADAVCELLDNDAERHRMRKRAYIHGRDMIWEQVAESYMDTFQLAREHLIDRPKTISAARNRLPAVNLAHLYRLTDDTGMIQHAWRTVPNYSEGYCVDDNARALLVTTLLEELEIADERELDVRYLAFLHHGYNQPLGRMRNFMSYDRRWLEEVGAEDSHARTIWAIGTLLGRSYRQPLLSAANILFVQLLDRIGDLSHPRPQAFALLGLNEYLRRFSGDRRAQRLRLSLAEGLLARYHERRVEGWHWFDDLASYDNATISQSLLLSGEALANPDMIAAGLESLTWLAKIQTSEDGVFTPIGSDGFARRGETVARFDQQPLEASAMVMACQTARRITGEDSWGAAADIAFAWFFGRNTIGLPLYDKESGGCRDGLMIDRVNQNQGAESTLSWLLALMTMHLTQRVEAEARVIPAVRTS